MELKINDLKMKNYECLYCLKCFSTHFNLKRHLQKIHNVSRKKEGEVIMEFADYSEFVKWKETEEKATKSNYVKHCGSITRLNGDVVAIYHCSRGGVYKPKGFGIKSLKSQGSSKIGTTCPARIKVTVSDEKAIVHYYPKHQFHEVQSEHLRLSYADRAKIAEKLRSGISVMKVLEDCNEDVTIGCGRKIITMRDIFNIKRDFNIKDPVFRSESDEEVSIIDIEETKGLPTIVTFKDISHTRDFIIKDSVSMTKNDEVNIIEQTVEHPTVIKVTPISTPIKDFSIRDTVLSNESDTEVNDGEPDEPPGFETNNSIIRRKLENILAVLNDCTLTAEESDEICEKLDCIFNICWDHFVWNPSNCLDLDLIEYKRWEKCQIDNGDC